MSNWKLVNTTIEGSYCSLQGHANSDNYHHACLKYDIQHQIFYLCANTLSPLLRLNIEILHKDTLPLPCGVGEEEKGKANELDDREENLTKYCKNIPFLPPQPPCSENICGVQIHLPPAAQRWSLVRLASSRNPPALGSGPWLREGSLDELL